MRTVSETVVLLCSGVLAVSHAVNVEYMTGNNKKIEYQDFEGAQVRPCREKVGKYIFYIYPHIHAPFFCISFVHRQHIMGGPCYRLGQYDLTGKTRLVSQVVEGKRKNFSSYSADT